MSKKAVNCPACNSKDIEQIEKEGWGQVTLGPDFSFKEIFFKCKTCGEEGDFLAKTDKYYLKAQKIAQDLFIKKTIDDLSLLGISMAFFERVFELPARTLTRWKTGDFSSSALALLRVIKTYPWITEVAENRFKQIVAKNVLIKAAVKEFEQEAEMSSIPTQTIETKNDSVISSHTIEVTQPRQPTVQYQT